MTTIYKNTAVKKTIVVIPEGKTMDIPIFGEQGENSAFEIIQRPFSKLSLSYIQNGAAPESKTMRIKITLERGAQLDSFAALFGGLQSHLVLETELIGEESSVKQRTLFFGSGDQIFDMFSNTTLHAPNTKAEIESKGVLLDCAHARFDGNIHITQTAKRANAKLIEHTLLLSQQARMDAIPGLKIDTNDVMAGHSASMTRVDDEQLFYCKSRGIEEKEATRLIVEGFLSSMYSDGQFGEVLYKLMQEKLCKV